MRYPARWQKFTLVLSLFALMTGGIATLGLAQDQQAPPSYPPAELDRMVSRIALYPDSLVAQILAAATFPDQIPDAANWADQHHYLRGDELAQAITADNLPWDPSVQALLPFPSVLGMMASDMDWTSALGNAFLAQQQDVMDAVQSMRREAYNYGYLRSNAQVAVTGGPYITIVPVNPYFVPVPVYDPVVVYAAPRPGFFMGGAIRFGFGISLGLAFRPWGWGTTHFVWGSHAVFISGARWNRTWVNRRTYVHPYAYHRVAGPRPAEHHELITRDQQERNAAREGRPRPAEHREQHHQEHHESEHHH